MTTQLLLQVLLNVLVATVVTAAGAFFLVPLFFAVAWAQGLALAQRVRK